jgi:hypothetical protein
MCVNNIMTTHIFIENATGHRWTLMDGKKQKPIIIGANTIHSLKLNYNPNGTQMYRLCDASYEIIMMLGPRGTITDVSTNAKVNVTLKNAEHHSLYNMLAPYCQHYEYQPDPLIISPYRCHVAGHYHNKLWITPSDNPGARVIPPMANSILNSQEIYFGNYQ